MARWAVLAWILAEIAAIAMAGRSFGVLAVLAFVLLTGAGGMMLLRAQGAATLALLRGDLRRGGDPRALVLRGGFRLAAGLLLLLPGLLGDVVGLALLVPGVQRATARRLSRWGGVVAASRPGPRPGPRPNEPGPRPAPEVIEAEWEEVERPSADPTSGPRPPSSWTRP